MKIRPEILIEAAVCSFAGLMIYILSLLIPIFIFIIPVPFIVLYVKRGPVWGILASLLACLLILLSSEMETAAILLIYTVFISHTLGFMIRQNTKASNIILWSTAGTAFFILLAGFFAQSFNEMNVVESLRETINQYASSQLSMINSMNISAGDKESLEAVMKTVAEYTMVLLPGILLMISGILSYANYYLVKSAAKAWDRNYRHSRGIWISSSKTRYYRDGFYSSVIIYSAEDGFWILKRAYAQRLFDFFLFVYGKWNCGARFHYKKQG